MTFKRLKITELDLQRIVFSEVYQRFSEPKAQRKAFDIMESAIKCIAKMGFDKVTLTMIARESGVTRPLLKYYFNNIDEILEFSIKYIRLLFQRKAVNSMTSVSNPKEMLLKYIDSCFKWINEDRSHAIVWLAFLHRAATSKKARELNTKAVIAGEERILSLIEFGQQLGEFQCNELEFNSKALQIMITGALISSLSENPRDTINYHQQVKVSCLRLLGAKSDLKKM